MAKNRKPQEFKSEDNPKGNATDLRLVGFSEHQLHGNEMNARQAARAADLLIDLAELLSTKDKEN